MELTFVCMGKKSISAESAEYFSNVEFVLRNIVRIDEDVIQLYDDYDIDHIHEDVIRKAAVPLVSPSGITNHSINHSRFRMQSSIRLQVKSIQGGMHARD